MGANSSVNLLLPFTTGETLEILKQISVKFTIHEYIGIIFYFSYKFGDL